ncbi:MAG: helix-turn-helix domain-containing protein [Steroidobacteraceae bacterium]|nr:helix-turn-helix domain-containing protein [Steroidobacteraceae bacterium]
MKREIHVAVLISERTAIALALLFRAILQRANRIPGAPAYDVRLVSSRSSRRLSLQGVTVATEPLPQRCDYLVVPPFDGFTAGDAPEERDVALVRDQHEAGAVVASACLGALTLASAGLLDGREATTHWAWASIVRQRYPRVNWAVNRMICDQRDLITAGGYLAMVDLALHLVATTRSRERAHELGQLVLADSVRQKQSVFAQRLIEPGVEHGELLGLTRWIERHLAEPLSAVAMARRCKMSVRSFHRKFVAVHGVTPRKFLQLKRIERVQAQLRTSRKSLEQILAEVGVSDVASFRRVFRRELGYSPAEYRRRLRARGEQSFRKASSAARAQA